MPRSGIDAAGLLLVGAARERSVAPGEMCDLIAADMVPTAVPCRASSSSSTASSGTSPNGPRTRARARVDTRKVRSSEQLGPDAAAAHVPGIFVMTVTDVLAVCVTRAHVYFSDHKDELVKNSRKLNDRGRVSSPRKDNNGLIIWQV